MQKIFLALVCWAVGLFATAQEFRYRFTAEIDSLVLFDTLPYRFQTASDQFSFIGDYKKAIEVRDQQFPNARPVIPTDSNKLYFSTFHPVSAREYILKHAANTRLLIINEQHHQPGHRAFVMSLLPYLKELGYTHIGFEALDYHDTGLSRRQYPILTSGYYVCEPVFGNLIRESFKQGLHVFPYEQRADEPEQGAMSRELAEATNIYKVMQKNPKDKFIIYCGYDHAIEDSTHNYMVLPMAGRLKRMSGIDPFTVDQVDLSEYNIVGNVFRKLIPIDSDAVYVDSTGASFFKSRSRHKKMDCMVYHPNTQNYYFRPRYMLTADKKLYAITPKVTIDFPCLVRVYNPAENSDEAVPTDVVELRYRGETRQIVVNKDRPSKVIIENRKGEKQEFLTE